mmetsp:Transcript_5871/g.16006  ORF Transcript_5871/g.16006 Transcript_5871/m.16006 type:complete len:145 (+) Transcript_5871:17-451(+)
MAHLVCDLVDTTTDASSRPLRAGAVALANSPDSILECNPHCAPAMRGSKRRSTDSGTSSQRQSTCSVDFESRAPAGGHPSAGEQGPSRRLSFRDEMRLAMLAAVPHATKRLRNERGRRATVCVSERDFITFGLSAALGDFAAVR